MLSNYIIYAPFLPIYPRVTCPWLLNGHLLLDFQHAEFSKDLHMRHSLPSAGKRYREAQGAVEGLSNVVEF